MGLDDKANTVYLFDYGLAKRYWDPLDNKHISYKDDKRLVGTARYASINTHLGIEQSRRDDMECLGYTLVYLMRGILPWQGTKGENRKEKNEKILQKKMAISINKLCQGLPTDIVTYMYYCRSLGFEDRPDYASLRNQFHECFIARGYNFGFKFDWNVPKPIVHEKKSVDSAGSDKDKAVEKGKKDVEEQKESKNVAEKAETDASLSKVMKAFTGNDIKNVADIIKEETKLTSDTSKCMATLCVPSQSLPAPLLRSYSESKSPKHGDNVSSSKEVCFDDEKGSWDFDLDEIGEMTVMSKVVM